jgi:hypothetical protein
MLSFMRPEALRRNMQAVAAYSDLPRATDDERRGYHRALSRLQTWLYPCHGDDPVLLYDLDEPVTLALAKRFVKRLDEGNLSEHQVPAQARALIGQRVAEALQRIHRVDEELFFAVHNLIGAVVVLAPVFEQVGGATAGDALGVVLLSYDERRTDFDLAACLVHEAVHQAQYLDEMVNGQFTDASGERAPVLVRSSIRGTQRPYELVFAAACVSAALALYAGASDPVRARAIAAPLAATVADLKAYPELVTTRGRHMLAELSAVSDRFAMSH